MGLILLSVIASVALGAVVVDWINDDDDSADAGSEDTGRDLEFDGSDTLSGTGGDDTLSSGQESSLAPQKIELRGGDDRAVVEDPLGIVVSGGAGNDDLSSTAVGNELNGGDGDDTLTGIDAVSMSGGAGDDDITFDSNVEANDVAARIDGGAGDDTIHILSDVGVDTPDRGGALVSGGSGQDSFEVVLDLQDSTTDVDSNGQIETDIVNIRDFDPDEDALVILLQRGAENMDRDVSVSLDQTGTGGSFTSEITLTFAKTATADEATSTLTVASTSPFGLDDIRLMGV